MAILNPPWDWEKPPRSRTDPDRHYLVLWHGCLGWDATSIVRDGIQVTKCHDKTDFGRGFYVTGSQRQAAYWANDRYHRLSGPQKGTPSSYPVMLWFRIRREALAAFQSLHLFVRGSHDHEDYWSFVHYCRLGRGNHKHTSDDRPTIDNWYDVVTGPVSAFWAQRAALVDYDQLSFHTDRAAGLLQSCIDSGSLDSFRIVDVI